MKKEELVLEIFFDEPTRHWRFKELMETAGISRPQAAYWLKKFIQRGIISRHKPRGKMPYYTADYQHPAYQSRKRLFALEKLYSTGFLHHLMGLRKARTIIIFGSLSRWDWYKESDLDLFIYGDAEGLETGKFRRKLHREVQIFVCKDKEELLKFNPRLLQNIIEGYRVKGPLDFVQVKTYA